MEWHLVQHLTASSFEQAASAQCVNERDVERNIIARLELCNERHDERMDCVHNLLESG